VLLISTYCTVVGVIAHIQLRRDIVVVNKNPFTHTRCCCRSTFSVFYLVMHNNKTMKEIAASLLLKIIFYRNSKNDYVFAAVI